MRFGKMLVVLYCQAKYLFATTMQATSMVFVCTRSNGRSCATRRFYKPLNQISRQNSTTKPT